MNLPANLVLPHRRGGNVTNLTQIYLHENKPSIYTLETQRQTHFKPKHVAFRSTLKFEFVFVSWQGGPATSFAKMLACLA